MAADAMCQDMVAELTYAAVPSLAALPLVVPLSCRGQIERRLFCHDSAGRHGMSRASPTNSRRRYSHASFPWPGGRSIMGPGPMYTILCTRVPRARFGWIASATGGMRQDYGGTPG